MESISKNSFRVNEYYIDLTSIKYEIDKITNGSIIHDTTLSLCILRNINDRLFKNKKTDSKFEAIAIKHYRKIKNLLR